MPKNLNKEVADDMLLGFGCIITKIYQLLRYQPNICGPN